MQKFSYHTHTTFSDGWDEPSSMLERACELGWEEIGFSDHLLVHKNIKQSVSWGRWQKHRAPWIYMISFKEAAEAFLKHAENIRKVAKAYPIKVRVGAEVDFFCYNGWLEEFRDFQKQVGLDYYISGNHMLLSQDGETIVDKEDSGSLWASEAEKELAVCRHYGYLCKAIESGDFRFIAHLDYMRKFPIKMSEKIHSAQVSVVDSLKKNSVSTEFSTKAVRKGGDFYPAENLLKELIMAKVPLVISDDAHRVDQLGDSFDKCEEFLLSHGCFYRWNYS